MKCHARFATSRQQHNCSSELAQHMYVILVNTATKRLVFYFYYTVSSCHGDDETQNMSGAGGMINNNGRNGSCLTWLATSLEEKRRWLVINASPRGQCSK